MNHEAKFYKKEPINKTLCQLCPHRCFISNNGTGICKTRVNEDGVLYTRAYGELTSYSVDPIEKKPLFNFHPGSKIFSIGSWGCNFKCTFCQNWQISQQQVASEHFEIEDVVRIAMENETPAIAYTYNEPIVWYEFVYDTAMLARKNGLKNVMVTNGFISEAPLAEILPLIDAMNIDLKSFSEQFYREVCDGQLAPVLRTIEQAVAAGVHVELTTLVIPGLNDREDIIKIRDWTAGLSPDIPLHLTRYFPQYKMNLDPTGLDVLKRAYETAREKLRYVYIGNVSSQSGESNTFCPACGRAVIKRDWTNIDASAMDKGKCRHCGETIHGKF